MSAMETETAASATSPTDVTLGPDWLRSKPVAVFSKYRYGQEEMLGLWAFTEMCPQTISQIPDLGASEPLKPVSISQYTDEEKDSYQPRSGIQLSGDRGRGRTSDRGRGRGGGITRGARRFDPNTRYYEKPDVRSADSDNWRRRDPEQPPSYPPFPAKEPPAAPAPADPTPSYSSYSPASKTFPPQIDDRETNSWKRNETSVPDPQDNMENTHFTIQEDSPEAMLRNISKTLYQDIGEPESSFNSQSIFSSFNNTPPARPGGGMSNSAASHLPSTSPSVATPTASMDMPSLFNREAESPSFSSVQQPFPSLSEIGKSLQSTVSEFRGQGFVPPPQPPTSYSSLAATPPTFTYRPDELWYYLDPKGNTQGPFDSVKMFSWFREGYFGMDLEIRRSTETVFTKIEAMISKCGRIPFQPDDKTSPPPGAPNPVPQQHLPTVQQHSALQRSTQPSSSPQAWTGGSIWGDDPLVEPATSVSSHFSNFMEDSSKAQRAEEMRKELERAMAMEQQRKQKELEEKKKKEEMLEKEQFILAQRQMIEAKMAEEQKQKEEEMRRFREEEIKKSKLFEEEAERIRQEKERLEQERQLQAEKVRIELEEAEKARQALAQERIKLERERQLVKQKEEELFKRAEAEKLKVEEEEKARAAEERAAAQKVAAEAKAIAKAMEDANAAAIREARRDVEQESVWGKDNSWNSAPEQTWNKPASPPATNPWSTPAPPSKDANPWAHIPKANVTSAKTRTPAPSTKGWNKPVQAAVPLSQIQQAEAERKKSAAPSTNKGAVSEPVSRQSGWGNPNKATNNRTRSLADIQREEEKRSAQQQNYANAQQNDWNPVAGMLEEDIKPRKQTKPTQPKQAQKQAPQKAAPKKAKAPAAPLLDMFSSAEPKDEFTVWCEKQVSGFKNQHIDVSTFISFLRDVESPREVREYVVSYLGDTLSTDKFIQEFISRRKSAKQGTDNASVTTQPSGNNKKGAPSSAPQQQTTTSRKNKRKKMQKVNAASLLGINCTASSDARNRGDIDTVVIQ